jgi:hypothetical protein
MHWQIITSRNEVTEIPKMLTQIRLGVEIAFPTDMLAKFIAWLLVAVAA